MAGGQSRRFGRNKVLEPFHGVPMIERAIAMVRPLCDSLLVVSNDLAPLSHLQATLVRDVIPRQGPLGGIFTALLFSPSPWVFVKAADMPFLVAEVVAEMTRLRHRADVVVPLRNGYYEPLFALYHVRCLPFIQRMLEAGKRQIVKFYSQVRVRTLEESQWRALDPDGLNFENINTIEDFERLQPYR